MASNGIPKDSCDPYVSGGGNSYTGQCNHQCSNEQFYHAKNVTGFTSINDAKMNIMQHGPVQTGFTVYQDFMSYKSGIYEHTWGSELGGHAVKIVGWGSQNGTDYWIATNQCGISDDIFAGNAATISG